MKLFEFRLSAEFFQLVEFFDNSVTSVESGPLPFQGSYDFLAVIQMPFSWNPIVALTVGSKSTMATAILPKSTAVFSTLAKPSTV